MRWRESESRPGSGINGKDDEVVRGRKDGGRVYKTKGAGSISIEKKSRSTYLEALLRNLAASQIS